MLVSGSKHVSGERMRRLTSMQFGALFKQKGTAVEGQDCGFGRAVAFKIVDYLIAEIELSRVPSTLFPA